MPTIVVYGWQLSDEPHATWLAATTQHTKLAIFQKEHTTSKKQIYAQPEYTIKQVIFQLTTCVVYKNK